MQHDLNSTSDSVFKAVFRQTGIFAGIMDLSGYLRDASDLSLTYCGYTKDQVLDRPFWETPWWRGSEDVKTRIRIATEQALLGNVFREELPYWVADGSERLVDFAMYPICDLTGEVVFINPTGVDITERKQIEIKLRESEQRLRWLASIVECSDDAVVSKNLDGIITSWNRSAERIFGYSAEEAIGQPITIVIPSDRQNEERDILTRIRRGQRVDHFETVRQRKDGSLIAVSLTISPVNNANGIIVGASKIARDISAQKKSQQQIATLAREAEHRSKNLLANAQAMVNLSKADSAEQLKAVIAGRISALANVNSLFVETRWMGADLSTIAAQEMAPYLEKDGQSVQIDGPAVFMEPDVAQALAVTLHELATNAAKYGALSIPGGRVDLKWFHEAGNLRMSWAEMGGPKVQTPTRKGFGSRVINQMIGNHSGIVRFDWRAEGMICEISLQV